MAEKFGHFREFLNYEVPYLGKYSTDFIEIWHTYSAYRQR